MDGDMMERQPTWWAVLLGGLVTLVLGLFLLASPAKTLFVLVVLLGVYWLVRGAITVVGIFTVTHAMWGWRLFAGIISILAGLFVIVYPALSTAVVPLVYVIVLGIQAILAGVAYMYSGFTGGGGGDIALGVLDVVVGLLLLGSPYVAALALPFVLGVLLIIGGVALLWYSFSLRSHQHMPSRMVPA